MLAKCLVRSIAIGMLMVVGVRAVNAQSVGLPTPRLLTIVPMGGQIGTEFDVVVSGDFLEDVENLVFSDARITAKPKLDAMGAPAPNSYRVVIAKDCPVGLYEARILTRLGISTSRIFPVGTLTEIAQKGANRSLATAQEVSLNSVTNGAVADRAVDYYTFQASEGQRLIVDCATRGIDSKLTATVILADEAGRDLMVDRRGGVLDFLVPKTGKYVVKLHELTFKGGPAFFYRLGLWELPVGAPIVRQPSTQAVNARWKARCSTSGMYDVTNGSMDP